MGIRTRQLLMTCLLLAFFGQTWLVYFDPAGRAQQLSDEAARGQSIWRENNCQSCHQLFGFGGFLGPDLTNSIDSISAERLASILTIGSGQMPAFHFESGDRSSLATYLRAIDATGVSQPRLGEIIPAGEVLRGLVEADDALGEEAARGWQYVDRQGCIGCHLPFVESLHRATDLTEMAATIEPERMLEVLRDGIPGKAMPRLMLAADDARDVLAFLAWMNAHGEEIRGRFQNLATSGELSLSKVPWFEYP